MVWRKNLLRLYRMMINDEMMVNEMVDCEMVKSYKFHKFLILSHNLPSHLTISYLSHNLPSHLIISTCQSTWRAWDKCVWEHLDKKEKERDEIVDGRLWDGGEKIINISHLPSHLIYLVVCFEIRAFYQHACSDLWEKMRDMRKWDDGKRDKKMRWF